MVNSHNVKGDFVESHINEDGFAIKETLGINKEFAMISFFSSCKAHITDVFILLLPYYIVAKFKM